MSMVYTWGIFFWKKHFEDLMTGLMDKGKMQPSGICIRLCQSGFDQNRLAVQEKMGRILVFINPDSYLIKSGHAKMRTPGQNYTMTVGSPTP